MDTFYDNKQSLLVQDHELVYYRGGEGEAMLLVHGITTYSFIWDTLVGELKKRYDLIVVDLLGCGDSAKPLNVPYSLKHHAEVLKDFVVALGIKKFHYVGHDLGGGIGQIFAVDYEEMLYDLVITNCVAFNYWPVQPIIAMKTPIIRQLAMATVSLGAFKIIVKRGIYHKERCTKEVMEAFYKPLTYSLGRKAFLHFAESLDNRDLTSISDKLAKLSIPVLILRGDSDVYLSEEIAEKLKEVIPNSFLKRIDTAGHFIQLDEPLWLVEEINTFIESSHS